MSILPEAKILIEEEEQVLAEVLELLNKQAQSGQVRFSTEQDRAKELTAELVATRRDEDKQMLASDEALSHRLRDMKHEELKGLDKLLERPYFARLVLEEEINGRLKKIEYKLGTVGNSECRIVDWRKAALAKLYYEYKEGDTYFEEIQGREREGKILRRHKVEIEDGRLVGLTCAYGDFRLNGGVWEAASGGRRRSGSRAGNGLPDVLSLITPEQFRLITEEAETAVLIQGVAGSGKTTVALHRLAWLLHDDNSQCTVADSLVLVRGKVLRDYIAHSLGHLQIADVSVTTTHDWLRATVAVILGIKPNEIIRPSQTPPSNYRLKHSIAFLRSLDAYCDAQRHRFIKFVEEKLQLESLPETAALDVIQCLDATTPLIPMAQKVVSQLQAASARYASNAQYAEILTAATSAAKNAFQRIQLYREDLLQVLSNGRAILAEDDTHLLDAAVITEALAFANRCKDENWLDVCDDALICYLHQKKTGLPLRPAGEQKHYSHVVVDEVQDHSPVELAVITQTVKLPEQLTLAGDSGQDVRNDSSFIGWEQLQKFRGFSESTTRYVQLEISYRSTDQIMRFANHIRGLQHSGGGRAGQPPLWYHCLTEESGVAMALDWLNRVSDKYPSDTTAVICANNRQLQYVASLLEPTLGALVRVGDEHSFTFEEGVIVTCVDDVKGLEFPHVMLWNPSEESYADTNLGRNRLYVAATRAEQHLCLVSWDKPSKLLPSIHSKLVRGIKEEVEEAQERESNEG